MISLERSERRTHLPLTEKGAFRDFAGAGHRVGQLHGGSRAGLTCRACGFRRALCSFGLRRQRRFVGHATDPQTVPDVVVHGAGPGSAMAAVRWRRAGDPVAVPQSKAAMQRTSRLWGGFGGYEAIEASVLAVGVSPLGASSPASGSPPRRAVRLQPRRTVILPTSQRPPQDACSSRIPT